MPADTKAKAYEWFMAVEDEARIIKWRWEPKNGVITSSMGEGTITLYARDTVDDAWQAAPYSAEMPWIMAQGVARGQGFTVEVGVYDG